MKLVKQKIAGRLVPVPQGIGLILAAPGEPAEEFAYVSYAFVTHGLEEQVLPSSILDDWGREIKSMALYEWVREHGADFPRAELFGFGVDGEERQHFLREFDLGASLPAFAFSDRSEPLQQARQLSVVILQRDGLTVPTSTIPDETVPYPLAAARVAWWAIPLGLAVDIGYDFSGSLSK